LDIFQTLKPIYKNQVQKKPFRKFGLVPKCTKRKSKSCWTGHCSLKRSLVRLSDQVPVASGHPSLGARLQLAQANCVQNPLVTFA